MGEAYNVQGTGSGKEGASEAGPEWCFQSLTGGREEERAAQYTLADGTNFAQRLYSRVPGLPFHERESVPQPGRNADGSSVA